MKPSTWGFLAAFCLAVGWLVLSSPTVRVPVSEGDEVIVCEPIGWGLRAKNRPNPGQEHRALAEQQLLDRPSGSTSEPLRNFIVSDAQMSLLASCQDARHSRRTAIQIVLALAIIWVILVRVPPRAGSYEESYLAEREKNG